MSDSELGRLYRTALEALAPSPNTALEKLRWKVAKAQIPERKATPQSIALQSGMGARWCEYAFDELRRTGFIVFDVTSFLWLSGEPQKLRNSLEYLAAIESAAILRARFMNREPSLPELDRRYAELRHSAEGQEPIAILLALQKLMLTIVARVGSSRLLEEYVTASPLSTFYLWNEALTPESVKSLLSRTDAMMAKLADNDARAASRTCQTIRLLPVEEVALAA